MNAILLKSPRITSAILAIVLALTAENALPYGPYDYSNPEHRQKYLEVVEGNHFNADVENLIRGMSSSVYGDLMYVLRTFPNHHRALNSIAKLYRREGGAPDYVREKTSLDEIFQRAIRFSPRDPMPHIIYGVHFQKIRKYDNALLYYDNALKLGLDSPQLHYNLGLLYADTKNYEKSLYHAKKAYENGYPLPGLRQKLVIAGVWD